MKEFHCDALELRFQFPSEAIDQEAFFKSAKIENREEYLDEDGDLAVGFSFGGREETTDYHAHMRLWLLQEGKGRIEIRYHDSKSEEIDKEPPYIEDFVQWLGTFIKVDKFTVHQHATYLFDDTFTPIISLPFPLVATEKALAGSLITGLSILFPKEENPRMAIIQSTGDDTYIALSTTSEMGLADLDLPTQLRKLSASVNPLIKKQELRNEKNGTHKDSK